MALSKKKAAKKTSKKKAPAAGGDMVQNVPPPESQKGEMRMIKILKAHRDLEHGPGETVEMNVHSAFRWVRRGVAEYA